MEPSIAIKMAVSDLMSDTVHLKKLGGAIAITAVAAVFTELPKELRIAILLTLFGMGIVAAGLFLWMLIAALTARRD